MSKKVYPIRKSDIESSTLPSLKLVYFSKKTWKAPKKWFLEEVEENIKDKFNFRINFF